jgi:hypothetical protein
MILRLPMPHTMLSFAAVQAEWAHTLDRINQLCPVLRAAEAVRPDKFAYITIDAVYEAQVPAIEQLLFANLLLRPLQRIEDRGTIEFQADWLWQWRKSVPWSSQRTSWVNRLFPDAPERSYVYRFNVVTVDLHEGLSDAG